MAIYLSRKKGITPTSITPSNSTPAALTSGSAVTPTANGYAIASYSSVTPSNSSPATLTSGNIVKLGGSGKAVSSVANITPTNVIPPSLSSGNIYKPSASGYAVSSYSEAWASDDDPPRLNYENIYCVRSDRGYLYYNKQNPIPDVASPDVNWHGPISAGGTQTISVTKKPRLIFIWSGNSTSGTSPGIGEAGLYDVLDGGYYRQGYYSSGYSNQTTGSNVQSVSSSSVVIENTGSTTRRYQVSIYY